jgi:hypothetical protein
MRYDDESLERALEALDLEETPADLHARIMAATVYRPAPVFQVWELWVVAFALAIATWLTLAILGNPLAGGSTTLDAIQAYVEQGPQLLQALVTPHTALWLGAGGLVAVFFTQFGLPGTEMGSET